MAAMLETPSRVWRRIQAVEDRDMPSLPSISGFEDSTDPDHREHDESDDDPNDISSISSPLHSTPAATSAHHTVVSTIRPTSSTSSTARFASSIASRSVKSSSVGLGSSREPPSKGSHPNSFDISRIPSLPNISAEPWTGQFAEDENTDEEPSKESLPDVYLPPEDEYDDGDVERDLSLTEALQSVSRTSSPPYPTESIAPEATPKKYYEYSVSLKSEPKPSPFDKYRNIAMRKTSGRTRTPSLTRTVSSRTTSPAQSTPNSTKSFALPGSNPQSPITPAAVPLPRSNSGSPAIHASRREDEQSESGESRSIHDDDLRSMDITEVHISPPHVHNPQPHSDSDEHPHQDEEIHTSSDEQEQAGSQDEHEPTFSSDGGPTPYAQNHPSSYQSGSRSPGNPASAYYSPAQSLAFTPTPAFPRPRARFDLPAPSDQLDTPEPQPAGQYSEEDAEEEQVVEGDHEDLLTPHTRRRSFLLSVINSTRPRLKFPTPHPRINHDLATPSVAESTPGPGISSGPRTNLQIAFAGVTPRPRPGMIRNPRPSHPLSQAMVASPGTSDSDSASPASGSAVGPSAQRRQSMDGWAPTSGNLSPYEGVNDRASFISTASSHDLTTHHRVNTSFDPAMGFGAGGGQGVGRFNAGKLNNYLHGLNRRLQEENEMLIERLQRLEEERRASSASAESSASEGGRRLSGGSRRVSAGGTVLGNVVEDVGGEGWMEEKAELEDMVDTLKNEKEGLEKELENQKAERAKDKERWKERMAEVEEGVSGIIKDLEAKIDAAEKKAQKVETESSEHSRELQNRLTEAEVQRDVATERAQKAERALESGKELGGELRHANERVGKLTTELRNAQGQIKELEEEVMRSDHKIDDLEKDLREDRDTIASLEEELNAKNEELRAVRARIRQLEEETRQLDEELRAARAYVTEMEEGAVSAVERIESLEDELASADEHIHAQKAQELARQMEHALEEAEKKMLADEDEINELKGRLAYDERERERQREASLTKESSRSSSLSADAAATNADLEALENELEAANREIARLNTLLNQSPARKAMEKARDMKIELLEREKEELLERNKALRMTMNDFNTPSKVINASGISPIHRQVLAMSVRAPRTPGAPLRDMSWLNNTTGGPDVSPLVAEISRLQKQLDRANDSIDDKLDKLEDAGLGVVGLTKKLEDARAKISALEDEIARLSRREERRIRCLRRTRCQKCHIKIDFSKLAQLDESSLEFSRDDLPSEPPTPPTRTGEALRAELQSVNAHLESMKKEWEQERRTLLGEKAVLQDAANRLNAQVKDAKEEMKKVAESGRAGERAAASAQGELDKAKRVISDLEATLKSERAQLRALTSEQNRVQREKAGILSQIQRTESDMEDVKRQLQKYKKESHELEKELRENANAEQKARLLEGRVAENAETIENLRQERAILAADHKELQRRFSEVAEEAERLRAAYGASSTSHDNRRHQLDLHRLEIDELKRALFGQAEELQRAEEEKHRISAEKSDVARTVAALEADLRRVKKDAEAFGRDLKLLRAQKEKQEEMHKEELAGLERSKKQAQTQIRLLNEQLESQRDKTSRARDEMKSHVCAADEKQLSAMKVQHKQECKGLIFQIQYLKAKFTRESSFRSDLAYQKQHLLVLLTQFEKSEQTIIAAIARIGFAASEPPPIRKRRGLKSIALAVVFLSRSRRASDRWRQHTAGKQAVANALQEVRRRRAQSS
ncbi:putative pericentrin-AKAP-450 domain of centrosomal targeting protein [Lyophyllum shimeji]|uniref:Pericentrin-AKAP-450 domain of centrosomal targeting protein n=1 Tax=Lyophyllum shimeji TaxID=47721 RepID=A0A9P3UNI3_LYOSH|nr:putative pericentrin-AKAP-450 domain of centrosomal targeting protein [Lyophyllum shimeji]